MKAVSVREIKKELKEKSPDELVDLCLLMAKFKKENKELLSYLLYDANHEPSYIEEVKKEIDQSFSEINSSSFFYVKKSIRKTLRNTKKYIRYSKKKETEAELLVYFCRKMIEFPFIKRSSTMIGLMDRTLVTAEKAIAKLHEDLQFDFQQEIEEIRQKK